MRLSSVTTRSSLRYTAKDGAPIGIGVITLPVVTALSTATETSKERIVDCTFAPMGNTKVKSCGRRAQQPLGGSRHLYPTNLVAVPRWQRRQPNRYVQYEFGKRRQLGNHPAPAGQRPLDTPSEDPGIHSRWQFSSHGTLMKMDTVK